MIVSLPLFISKANTVIAEGNNHSNVNKHHVLLGIHSPHGVSQTARLC